MIEIKDISLPLGGDLQAAVAKKIKANAADITELQLLRKSVDARKKNDVHFNVSVAASLRHGESKFPTYVPYKAPEFPKLDKAPAQRPVVCGAGPAGLFAALILARGGARPILLERGAPVEQRAKDIEEFHQTRRLNTESNVQFGEGGAGAFSDGKLNTGTHDPRSRFVLQELVQAGAPEEILWEAKPHIGTDKLPLAVAGLRQAILAAGGEIHYHTKVTDLRFKENTLQTVIATCRGQVLEFPTNALILSAGHSARDLFQVLYEKGVKLIQKPFSMGVRCEHPQEYINQIQYGAFAKHPALGAADYKLAIHLKDRSVYSFCMCPGGTVVAAASEEGLLAVNGMSTFARDGQNANAAILAEVRPEDFGSDHPLAGVELQRAWEKAAYLLGGSDYTAPAQLLGDFLQNVPSTQCGNVLPSYPIGVRWCNVSDCLPEFVHTALREAFPLMDQKMQGYVLQDAVLTGIESRSSSPVRIVRNESGQANKNGLFPCGEGAGYAGGILSAAVDGIRQAERVLEYIRT